MTATEGDMVSDMVTESDHATYARQAETMDHYQMSKLIRSAALAKSRIDELTMTAAKEFERISYWLDRATEADRRLIVGIEAQAEAYMAHRLQTQPKGSKKSVDFPDGRIESREQPPKFRRDDDVVLAWATERNLTRTGVAPPTIADWQEIKKRAQLNDGQLVLDGEVVPGVEVEYPAPAVSLTIYAEGRDSVRSQIPEFEDIPGQPEGVVREDGDGDNSGVVQGKQNPALVSKTQASADGG